MNPTRYGCYRLIGHTSNENQKINRFIKYLDVCVRASNILLIILLLILEKINRHTYSIN